MTQSDSERLNLIKNDVAQNKLKDSSLLFRKFIIHELDFMKLANLAVRTANNSINTKATTNTTETTSDMSKSKPIENNNQDIPMDSDDGGGIPPQTNEHQINKTTTNDDLLLRKQIQRLLDDESLSCQSRSEKIISIIYNHNKAEALAVTREQLDNPEKKKLLKGGGNDSTKTNTTTKTKTKAN